MPLLKVPIFGPVGPVSRFVPPQAHPFVQEILGLHSQGLEARNLISGNLIPLDRDTGLSVEFSLFSAGHRKPVLFYLEAKGGLKLWIKWLTVIEDNLGLVRGWTWA